jgi:glycosyltransferase involved in cell wall biosynthesis
MDTRKICFFISSLSSAGGTERVCTEIANKLSTLGFSVTVLSMYSGEPFFKLGKNVGYFFVNEDKSFSKVLIPATVFKLRQRLKIITPDVLVNVDSALFIYSAVAGVGLKIKNLVWEHFNYKAANYSLARRLSRKFASNYSNGIITLTQADNINWKKSTFCKTPVFTINNPSPVDAGVDHQIKKKQIVLAVGRLNHQKGFDLLLDAWYIVNSTMSDWELHIVGSGDLKGKLEEKINTLGLTPSVKLIPATPSIYQYYSEAGIYCLSSRFEGFPMVLLEAQAFGLPIVSFDCETGPAEIIKHNETGLLVKNGDTKALAEALASLIADEATRVAMGANALKNALNYSLESIIIQWQKLLSTV